MSIAKPNIIRTLDFTQNFASPDNTDHVAVAQFVEAAHQDYTLPHQLIGYMGYPVEQEAANVTGADLTNKINAYYAYDPYDYDGDGNGKCPDVTSPTCPPEIKSWLERNYASATIAKTDHLFETMDGDSGSLAGHTGDSGITPTTVQFGSDLWVFYYDAADQDLRYAKVNGLTPNSWTFGALDSTGNVGKKPSAVVHNNTLHVFYYDQTNTNLRHAWLPSGGAWQFNNLDGDSGSLSGQTGDVGLTPAVTVYGTSIQLFYQDNTNKNLRHAWSDGTNWWFETLDGDTGSILHNNADTGYNPSVTVYQGTLQLFYYDNTNGNLRHVWENNGWNQEVLDGDSTVAGRKNTALGLNSSATTYGPTLQLVYYDQTNGDLRHAWFDTTWHFENLDGDAGSIGERSGNVGATPYITNDGTTLQVLAYDSDRQDLRHYWTSSSVPWQIETLDGQGDDGTRGRINGDVGKTPVAVPFAGNWHVFYYDQTNTNLRHSTL